jgi:hypothetical protein
MGKSWRKGLSIDRIDVNKGYSPQNCRWANRVIQDNNRTGTVWVEINGVKKPLTFWAKEYGISRDLIYHRIWDGWNPIDAVITPRKEKYKLKKHDVVKIKKLLKRGDIYQWQIGDIFGVSRSTILSIKLGNNWKNA